MKKAILICACSYASPSMKNLNFADLTERVRLELPHNYLLIHPRLCEANGEALLEDLVKKVGTLIIWGFQEKKFPGIRRSARICALTAELALTSAPTKYLLPVNLHQWLSIH